MNTHYFSAETNADAGQTRQINVRLRGQDLNFEVSDAVFSAHRLDPGTAELVKAAPKLPPAGSFLDLGSGWGVIATFMGLESPAASVLAVDVNPRAVALTQRNAQAHGATNVRALTEDLALRAATEEDLTFDVIWSNPPVRIGKPQLRALLMKWLPKLTPEGQAILVMSRHLGADSTASWLRDQGFTVKRLGSRKGFRLLQVTKGPGLIP